MRITGTGGELRVGARVAAVLGPWTLERPTDRMGAGCWVVAASLRRRDDYWSQHGGVFDLVVPAGAVAWAWRGVRVSWGEQGISIQGTSKPEVVAWASSDS